MFWGLGAGRVGAIVGALIGALVFAGAALGVREISIAQLGFLPGVVNADGQQDLRWTNETEIDQSVTSTEGLFDSGVIPPGGGFSMKLQVPGNHPYRSTTTNRRGTIVVPLHALPGGSSEPAAEHIPDLAFPPVADGDVMLDPRWGVPASRTRALLGFRPGVTVGQANAALAAAQAVVIGGLADAGILLVQLPESPVCGLCDPFSNLKTGLASLRGDPSVHFAAMSVAVKEASVPRGPEPGRPPATSERAWSWSTRDTGGNWGLKAARFPQAWNFLESIRRKSPSPITAVIDSGFDTEHEDLASILTAPPEICSTPTDCHSMVSDSKSHGTQVAGIIGAAYDNDLTPPKAGHSVGVSGGNPVARMEGYSWVGFASFHDALGGAGRLSDGDMELFDLILRTRAPNLRVINFSTSQAHFTGDDDKLYKDANGKEIWWKRYPGETCGPGENDDTDPDVPKKWCTPSNEDGWLREFGQIGLAAKEIARLASRDRVMIVQAAGNTGIDFCPPSIAPCDPPLSIRTEATAEFAWASKHWRDDIDYDAAGFSNPILIAESLDSTGITASMSNVGGNILAAGNDVLSTTPGNHYAAHSGTSFAAPHVSALVGYLVADDPAISVAELRHRVLDYAKPPQMGGDAPVLDAFASMLGAPGAAKRLVDVNDLSKDGNRRVVSKRDPDDKLVWGQDNTSSRVPGELSAPDGYVDMRDFRRLRDAYLQICALGVGDVTCPQADRVHLDGLADHPKKDLNFDHCVFDPAVVDKCNAKEQDFSRFDFNGDGSVDVFDKALVPLTADGKPAANRAAGTEMDDLEVLQSQWSLDPKSYEGWNAGDLRRLLQSADLEVHGDALFQDGASTADLQVRRVDTGLAVGPERTLKRGDDFALVTIPLGEDTSTQYEVVATTSTAAGTRQSESEHVSLDYGDDRRVDLCSGLTLRADPAIVAADGSSTSKILLTVDSCNGSREVAGRPIAWSLSPSTGGAALDLTPGTTDGNGKAEARFVAGNVATAYTIKATVDLGGGVPVEVTIPIRTVPKLTIRYAWRQVYEDYDQSGSTRWATASPLTPDCTFPGVVEYCIDSWHVALAHPDVYGAQRDGILVGSGSTFKVTEAASNTFGMTRDTWTTSKPDGATKTGADVNQWFVTDPHAYQDHGVKGVRTDERADGVHLANLDAVGKLPYHYTLTSSHDGGPDLTPPLELGVVTTSMLLIPQEEGRQIRFAAGPGKEIVFERNPDGSLKPFQSCGRLDEDLTTEPGYYVAGASDYIPGATTVKRKPDYTGGDRPMPVGPGHLRIRYAFAAVAAYTGQTAADPQVPDCTQNQPPTAAFSYTPQAPDEGRQVHFVDASTDTENDVSKWAWSFGDGSTASTPNAWHIYEDNGTYDVTLSVTDRDGATDSTTKQVVVANLLPEAEIDDVSVLQGQPLRVVSRLMDAGAIDKTRLQFSITSTNEAWPELGGTRTANVYTDVWTMPPGIYPLTLTVTDKDGAVATATALAVVDGEAPPPTLPASGWTCDPNLKLDGEETRFLDEVNDYRARNGLDPVAVSPTLNRAAEEHADDMATHGFLSHTGSDGSMPWDRAWRAGYPRDAANSENIARGTPYGHDALWAWRGSTQGHNENMLNPDWRAIGIARQQGSGDWYWSTSYGDELDCPNLSAPLERPSVTRAADDDEQPAADAPASSGGVETEVVVHRLAGGATTTAEAPTPAYPPTAAFTIDKTEPITGKPVTFTNRSRDALGTPIGATIRFGDGTAPRALGPDESTQYTYDYPQDVRVEVTATDSTGKTASVRRFTSVGDPPEPWMEYTGPTEVVSGPTLAAKVKVTTREGGPPLPGLTIRFKLGWDNAHTATAVTDENGVAAADISLDGVTPGYYYLSIQFDGTPDWGGLWIAAPVTIIGNQPPVADAGGPYVTGMGTTLLLDGSGSSDPDGGDWVESYGWDLDGDGVYDDATGRFPLPVNWDDVRSHVCGGTCQAGHDYTIGLHVTDSRGESSTASAIVRFASDFMLTLGGDNRTVVPGKSNSFAVSVIGAGDFNEPVTLSVEGLPDGITGELSVNPVLPGHMSVLTLTASDDAQTGQFPVVVSGTAGGVTHTVSDELKVAFGLIPICHGTIAGTVKDGDTGQPVAGVRVDELNDGPSALTDASGRFTFRNASLGDSNTPLTHYIEATKYGWWRGGGTGLVACGGTTTIDIELLKGKSVHASGKVVEGEADPIDHHSIPTDRPLPNASIVAQSYFSLTFGSDADGKWAGDLPLGPGNTPSTYNVIASAVGYWSQAKLVTAADDDLTGLDFALVKKCYGTVKGGVVVYPDGSPARNHTVQLLISPTERYAATTDANGNFTFNRTVSLGYNNTPISYELDPIVLTGNGPDDDPPGSGGEPGFATFTKCGDESTVRLRILRAEMRYAWVEGHVTDDRTHEPIGGATVWTQIPGDPPQVLTTTTDDTGYYKIKVGLGYGYPQNYAEVKAAKQGFEGSAGSAFVHEGEVGQVNMQLHRPLALDRTLTGLVRDASTGAPIAAAWVTDGCNTQTSICVHTGDDGRYTKTLSLDDRTPAFGRYMTASADGYWPQAKSVTLPPNATTTLNFELVRKCETATVSGTVVDAQTQLPIGGAMVVGGGALAYTDPTGSFRLEHLEPGVNNAPLQVAITASASGYYSQTKTVTIFCGANVVVDFGKRETSRGIIAGTVTNAATGQPMANVFVGGEFGGSATTDASGDYRIENVPLGDLNSDREWHVTAIPDGFPSQTKTVVARANVVVRADFTFGTSNHAPTASPQSLETDRDVPLPITLSGADADGDPLTYTVTSPPAHGTLTGPAPSLQYQPESGWSGTDSLAFVVADGVASSEPATVTITVKAGNAAPTAADDHATVAEEGAALIDVLANDSPGAGEPAQQLTATLLGSPQHGTASVTAGGIAYAPAQDFNGTDSLDYRACDDGTPSECATANLTITVTPVNDAPAVTLDPIDAAPEGSTVSLAAHGHDVDGDPLTFTWHADGGTLTANGDAATLSAADGPAAIAVSVSADDGSAGATAATTVHVVNVAPAVDAGPGLDGSEGAPVSLDASFTDPGADTHNATVDWGDGSPAEAAAVDGGAVHAMHAYGDDGAYTATVTVGDDDSETGIDTTTVQVHNAAPTADAGADLTAPWGIQVAFGGTVSDPGAADTAAGFEPRWTFGDGSAPAAGLATTHAYAAPGTFTATLRAKDKDGAEASDDVAVRIVRRDTGLTAGGSAAPFGPVTLSATLTDVPAGAGLGARDVVFELSGSTYSARTGADGRASVTTPAPLAPGTHPLTVRFAGDDLYAASSASASVDVTVAGTPGLVTGGDLRSMTNGRGGFNVHSDGTKVWGELQYESPTAGNFHASKMTGVGIAANRRSAWFAGAGDDGRSFVAYAEDNGDPGTRDIWRLWLGGRLETDGKITGGNIQIHG